LDPRFRQDPAPVDEAVKPAIPRAKSALAMTASLMGLNATDIGIGSLREDDVGNGLEMARRISKLASFLWVSASDKGAHPMVSGVPTRSREAEDDRPGFPFPA